ncbi:MAG: glucose-6-phosphate isomerase [Chloroflexi bacterium]|nr:glucose-6-phosphate isomerase [Chloroflexota bacterium]
MSDDTPHQLFASLDALRPPVQAALERTKQQAVLQRLWAGDYTLWQPGPTEIADRLGWLDLPQAMGKELRAMQAFAEGVRQQGFRYVVLLGMGGSSLGPEVLRQTFGSMSGYPRLIVLDSTVPAWVQAVTQAIEPSRTLFLVSSKSGTTIEPLSFYTYFRRLLEGVVGQEKAGESFVAITDPGTPLQRMAQEQGFRHAFLNPQDIGGRYSVLSLFGLVPAALQGIDLEKLLARAETMRQACAVGPVEHENPGAWLGAAMAALALRGRDKLTLVLSPAIASFGLWVEQLIAESTGKEGKGIVPIAGEPLAEPGAYGNDRFFVYVRLEGDGNAPLDEATGAFQRAGHPVVTIHLRDRYDLGAEFYRWEFATAIAGHLLGIHPFDQPDVQGAKDATNRLLERYRRIGHLPEVKTPGKLHFLLEQARPGDYLAVLAYLPQSPDLERAVREVRLRVMRRHRIATTFGYGPRFLHSTGQLHKGGPNTGLFLQLTQAHTMDIPIPGEDYTFGVLADAQALGDLHSLEAAGRRLARVKLAPDYLAKALERLAEEVDA